MADAEEETALKEEPPPPELSPAEKIEALKEALARGELGPSQFDAEFQKTWLAMKDVETAASVSGRTNHRGSVQARGLHDVSDY